MERYEYYDRLVLNVVIGGGAVVFAVSTLIATLWIGA